MKKSFIITLTVLFLLSIGGTAFGANNFSDVPTKHWAYDAVSQLQKSGLFDGYGDGTFRGDKPLTRYEFASLTARGLENYNKANAQQKVLLDKLAIEFVTELNNMGVRLTKLEKTQPNLKITGSSELRYTAQDFKDTTASSVAAGFRLFLNGVAKVDEDTELGLRLMSGVTKAGTKYKYDSTTFTSFGNTAAADDNRNTVTLDRYFLTRKIGAVKTTLGAQELKIGIPLFIVDNNVYSYDGVKFAVPLGQVNLVSQWGRQQKSSAVAAGYKIGAGGTIVPTAAVPASSIEVASLEASTNYGKLNYGVGYATLKDDYDVKATLAKYLYGNAVYTFGSKFSLGGEYVQNREFEDNNNAWTAVATIGDQAIVKNGQNNIVIKYWDVGKHSISRMTNYTLQNKAAATDAFTDVKNQKGYYIAYNYGFSKNLTAYVLYSNTIDDEAVTANNDKSIQFGRVGIIAKF